MSVNGVQIFRIVAGGDDDLLCARNKASIVSVCSRLLTFSQKSDDAGPLIFQSPFSPIVVDRCCMMFSYSRFDCTQRRMASIARLRQAKVVPDSHVSPL